MKTTKEKTLETQKAEIQKRVKKILELSDKKLIGYFELMVYSMERHLQKKKEEGALHD